MQISAPYLSLLNDLSLLIWLPEEKRVFVTTAMKNSLQVIDVVIDVDHLNYCVWWLIPTMVEVLLNLYIFGRVSKIEPENRQNGNQEPETETNRWFGFKCLKTKK